MHLVASVRPYVYALTAEAYTENSENAVDLLLLAMGVPAGTSLPHDTISYRKFPNKSAPPLFRSLKFSSRAFQPRVSNGI